MADADIVQLESEKQEAERFKVDMTEALRPILALMDEAKSAGLLIEFQLGIDAYCRASIASCGIVKRY